MTMKVTYLRILFINLFFALSGGLSANNEVDSWYEFDDDGQTITGISYPAGISHVNSEQSLIIPPQVTKVTADAFSTIASYGVTLSELIIDGGNPVFEMADGANALASVKTTLCDIDMGSGMSVANMATLLEGLGSGNCLESVVITNTSIPADLQWTSEALEQALTEDVRVILPAALVGSQVFGGAKVYGRFVIPEGIDLSSFCVTQTFRDTDDGSNLTFYIPKEVREQALTGEKKLYIERVHFLVPHQGVLMHNASSTSSQCDLERIDPDNLESVAATRYESDMAKYDYNMLVGVIVPTAIGRTETKSGVEYTNMILYNGSFYRTSGGTLGDHRAYLQVRTSDLSGMAAGAKLSVTYDDESTAISLPPVPSPMGEGSRYVYDLQGRKVTDNPSSLFSHSSFSKGIYIVNGKKIAIN